MHVNEAQHEYSSRQLYSSRTPQARVIDDQATASATDTARGAAAEGYQAGRHEPLSPDKADIITSAPSAMKGRGFGSTRLLG